MKANSLSMSVIWLYDEVTTHQSTSQNQPEHRNKEEHSSETEVRRMSVYWVPVHNAELDSKTRSNTMLDVFKPRLILLQNYYTNANNGRDLRATEESTRVHVLLQNKVSKGKINQDADHEQNMDFSIWILQENDLETSIFHISLSSELSAFIYHVPLVCQLLWFYYVIYLDTLKLRLKFFQITW